MTNNLPKITNELEQHLLLMEMLSMKMLIQRLNNLDINEDNTNLELFITHCQERLKEYG